MSFNKAVRFIEKHFTWIIVYFSGFTRYSLLVRERNTLH